MIEPFMGSSPERELARLCISPKVSVAGVRQIHCRNGVVVRFTVRVRFVFTQTIGGWRGLFGGRQIGCFGELGLVKSLSGRSVKQDRVAIGFPNGRVLNPAGPT